MLLVGYATFYTMAPVFSLVLDEDISEENAFKFPELYKELQKGRHLSLKTFFIWVLISAYQGGMIMIVTLFLFEDAFINIVSITFTALILAELTNVAFEIRKWSWPIVLAELFSVIIYFVSMLVLPTYFDLNYVFTPTFWWKTAVVIAISCFPIYIARLTYRKCYPPIYTKLD